MPPVGKPLKNDGPACRVCGCTEHNACVIHSDATFTERLAKAVRMPAVRMPRLLTCSWVKVEGATQPLCSACSGTEADIVEVTERCTRMIRQHGGQCLEFVGKALAAALARRVRRHKATEKG